MKTPYFNWVPTQKEKNILQETWEHDFEFLFDIGANVYSYIFATKPETKEMFPNIKKHGDKYAESDDFRRQILRIVKTMLTVLENIEDLDCVVDHLYDIGKRHTHYLKQGFRPEHWDLFQCSLSITLNDHTSKLDKLTMYQKDLAIKTWTKVVEFIIFHMKRGLIANLPPEYK